MSDQLPAFPAPHNPPSRSTRADVEMSRYFSGAFWVVVILIVGLGGWSSLASISGAVIAPASVSVESNANVVQHLEGGIVGKIHVKDGDRVKAGDLLISLRTTELVEEIAGLKAQREAKAHEIELINDELEGLKDLLKKGLVPKTRVVSLQREQVQITGDRGRLAAEEARAQAKLNRLEIRAPIAGFVHDKKVNTVGEVIKPGMDILQIVPSGLPLIFEAKLKPQDIDQVHVGQSATIRLSSFNQRTTPELTASVKNVSADLVEDERKGTSYYRVHVDLNEGELERLGGKQLVPGMPAEVFIKTDKRSALSYLVKPLTDQLSHAFREE